MNNTTTARTLSVAAIFIAATLVVGATLAATTFTPLAAFASKKGNGNGNTDTNQKTKQDGTQSGFDNTFEQEGQNLICTHPDDNATCSQEGITSTPKSTLQTTTGTLLVKKVVDCKGDLQCIRFNSVNTFIITVTGNDPHPPVFQGSSSTAVTLGQGTYTVSEIPQPNGMLPPTFSGDCTSTGSGSFSATGAISANNLHQTCTITNVNACLIPGFCR
jgi:hypothetical protein